MTTAHKCERCDGVSWYTDEDGDPVCFGCGHTRVPHLRLSAARHAVWKQKQLHEEAVAVRLENKLRARDHESLLPVPRPTRIRYR